MPWIKFERPFNYVHNPLAVTHYRAGHEYLVKEVIAQDAEASGAGHRVREPIRRSRGKR